MNRGKTLILAAMLASVSCFGVGCGSGDEQVENPQQVVRTKPKAKPRPKAKTITELQSSLSIDGRILLDELDAPRDEAARIAILQFFNAILNTDVSTLQGMLAINDQIELGVMMDSGLDAYMQNISLVQLQTGSSPEGQSCVLALFEIGLNYQVQMWYYQNSGSGFTFESGSTRPNLVGSLSGNWITNYFELLDKQIEIANQADVGMSYTLAGEATTSDSRDSGPRPPSGPGPQGPRGPAAPGK